MELAQWQNIVSRAQDGPILLNVPFAFPDGMSAGELRIHRDGKKDRGQDDDGPTTVVLLLDMTGLGPIRIDAWISTKRAAVRVTVSEEDAAGFVSGLSPSSPGAFPRWDTRRTRCAESPRRERDRLAGRPAGPPRAFSTSGHESANR